jgi:pilus assembly protein CpaC
MSISFRHFARATAFGLLLAATALSAPSALGEETRVSISPNAYGATRAVEVDIHKTILVDLPAAAAEVIVSRPEVAAAVMRTQNRAILQGVTGGDTNIFFLDAEGRTIAVLDVKVLEEPSEVGNALQSALSRAIPGSRIIVESVTLGDDQIVNRVVLTGTVLSGEDRERATLIATQFAGSPENVANIVDVAGTQQVMLQVTVSEVKRNIAKQFGVNLSGSLTVGSVNLGLNAPPSTAVGNYSGTGVFGIGNVQLNAAIHALETRGGLRILAQPTLTAISGQAAEFKVGGEFPVPVRGDDGDIVITYKDYGIKLNFTPVVKSNGLIGLTIDTEVSEVQTGTFALTDRSAKTAVELRPGTTLAIGGLLQERSNQQINQLPGLGNIPILGALFRSRDYQSEQTELVILVTPFLVAASPLNAIPVPTDQYQVPTDAESIFLGKVESLYGVGTTGEMRGSISGSVGFVLD